MSKSCHINCFHLNVIPQTVAAVLRVQLVLKQMDFVDEYKRSHRLVKYLPSLNTTLEV